MVKFIVEVDEEYIHKNADFSLMLEQAENMEGIDSLAKMAGVISFSVLETKIEAGEKEFVITRDKSEKSACGLFDDVVARLAALSGFSERREKQRKRRPKADQSSL